MNNAVITMALSGVLESTCGEARWATEAESCFHSPLGYSDLSRHHQVFTILAVKNGRARQGKTEGGQRGQKQCFPFAVLLL